MTTKPTRRRTAKPKRNAAPTFELIPLNWTNDQALAVYDFCSALQELVWRRYHDALVDPLLKAQFQACAANPSVDRTYPLPFDDTPL